MKAKQKNLRIFEIEITDEEAFFAYMEKNKILLKDFFLLIRGHTSDAVTEYLDREGFCYKLARECPIKIAARETTDKKSAIIEPKSTQKTDQVQPARKHTVIAERVKTLVIQRPIRSGVEVEHAGDITIFGRVNSAAKVLAEGNVEVYGVIDGLVQCDGEYMIVKDLGKGHIIFNGEIIDREIFDGRVKRITYGKEGVEIKDLFETTHY